MLHPASLLLIWGAGLFLIQSLPPTPLPLTALALGGLAFGVAGEGMMRLVRRTRWLFLTMAVLFVFFTPGVRLGSPLGDLGVTVEGVDSAIEHCLRLFCQLAWLVVLIDRLGTAGMISGLHLIVRLIPGFSRSGNSLVIRLALTLEAIGGDQVRNWKTYLNDPSTDGVASIAVSDPDWTAIDTVTAMFATLTVIVIAFVLPR